MTSGRVVAEDEARYSDYSRHFLDIDDAAIDRNIRKLESRLEQFRLKLDLALIARFAKGHDLLDFPIGTGRIYPHLMQRFNVHGYDICEPYVARAKALHGEIADHFAVCSFEQVEEGRQFDTILSFRVLTRVKDIDLAIRNVHAITRPGGRWIFTYWPGDQGPGLEAMGRSLAKAGFSLIARERYDVAARTGGFGLILGRVWPYWRAAIERGLVPFSAYRLFDALVARGGTGTYLFVAERS